MHTTMSAFLYIPQTCYLPMHSPLVWKKGYECRSVPQTIVHTPPCWNGLEVLFMLSQSSARNSKQNPGRHELKIELMDKACMLHRMC